MKKATKQIKDEIFYRIQTDLKLRNLIGQAKGIQGNSVRSAAIATAPYFYDINILEIIADYLNCDLDSLFNPIEGEPIKTKNPKKEIRIERIQDRWLINGFRHDKLSEEEKELLSGFTVYMREVYNRQKQKRKR